METKTFIKQERNIFLWVNIGCLILLAVLMIWKYCTWIHAFFTPCIIHDYLHVYCPGCGGTRAVYALLGLNIWESFVYHPIVPFCALVFVDYYIGAIITLIRNNGKRYYYLRIWFCYIALGIVVLNFVLRNVMLIVFHVDPIGDLLPFWM